MSQQTLDDIGALFSALGRVGWQRHDSRSQLCPLLTSKRDFVCNLAQKCDLVLQRPRQMEASKLVDLTYRAEYGIDDFNNIVWSQPSRSSATLDFCKHRPDGIVFWYVRLPKSCGYAQCDVMMMFLWNATLPKSKTIPGRYHRALMIALIKFLFTTPRTMTWCVVPSLAPNNKSERSLQEGVNGVVTYCLPCRHRLYNGATSCK